MKGQTMNATSNILIPLFLGVLIAGIVFATLTGRNLPLIGSPRSSLVAILIIGLAMCAPGIVQVAASGRWASPLAILGYVLGGLILMIILSAFAGWKLPMVYGDTQAVTAVGILIAVKFLIGLTGNLFHWL